MRRADALAWMAERVLEGGAMPPELAARGSRLAVTVTGFVVVVDQSPLTTSGPGPGVTSVSGGVLCTGPSFDGAIANPSAVTPFPGSSGCSLM